MFTITPVDENTENLYMDSDFNDPVCHYGTNYKTS